MGRTKSRETSEMANSTENITESLDRGVDSAVIGLEKSSSDWFITCHQFISGLLFSQICVSSLLSNHQLT